MGTILLYYIYRPISDPENLKNEQRAICESLNLKGRIIIAQEGMNATLGGTAQAIEKYKEYMLSHALFRHHAIDFKEAPGSADYFPRLQVKVKKELVNLGIDLQKRPLANTGIHLTPQKAHDLIANKPDNLVILDARNQYESAIGAFEGAVKPPIANFRNLAAYIDAHPELFKDKQVLMYCTGGIRCEPASAYLKTKNIAQEVYQIEGGICRYVEQYPDGYFKGKNYVFDGRVAVPVTQDTLASCRSCAVPFDDYTNCINAACNKQIILCPPCLETLGNTCDKTCLDLVQSGQVVIRTIPKKVSHSRLCSI